MRRTRAVWLSVFGGALLLAGCSDVMARVPGAGYVKLDRSAATESDLRAALATWATNFSALVNTASDRMRTESRDRNLRRNTLLWRLRMVPLARDAAFRPDAQEAYVAAVAVATAQHLYLSEGEGRALFGAHQPVALEAALRIEQDALTVGKNFLSDAQIERLQRQVDALVAAHPIEGIFSADALVQGFAASSAGGAFAWVVDLPMLPFRALSGVSDTAAAVHEFNETARKFTETAAELPQLTRLELELLLYDAEELESTARALAAAESFADGAERISGVAETLPHELGAELEARLEQSRATLAELDGALARAETLAGPLSHVADRIGEASAQWTALLAELRAGDEKGESGRPFDIREYAEAADRIAAASRELHALIAEVNALDAAGTQSLVDAAAWRLAALIALFFLGLTVYRLATRSRG